jgi:hypothetical protein
MKRIRIEQPKARKECQNDPLPLDPLDPDILRAKRMMSVRRSHPRKRVRCSRSSEMLTRADLLLLPFLWLSCTAGQEASQ